MWFETSIFTVRAVLSLSACAGRCAASAGTLDGPLAVGVRGRPRHAGVVDCLSRKQLLEMMLQVSDVVENQMFKRHGGGSIDSARSLLFVRRDLIDEMREEEVVGGPELDEQSGVGVGVVLDLDVCSLIVAGPVELGLSECADEALVIVCGRIDEVAEKLEVCPLAFAAGMRPIDAGKKRLGSVDELCQHEKSMAALIDAISVKRRTLFEHEGVPFVCLDSDVSTPTARGGQTLVRLKVRNLLTRGVFDKTFKAGDKFKEPDLSVVSASYLYSDGDGSHFLDQESFETLTLSAEVIGSATDYLVDGTVIELQKYEGNPIGIELPQFVELAVAYTEPGVKGDTSSGSVTKPAKLETGLEIKVPLFIKQGEKVKVATETGEFAGRA